jgi:hypothetical protein
VAQQCIIGLPGAIKQGTGNREQGTENKRLAVVRTFVAATGHRVDHHRYRIKSARMGTRRTNYNCLCLETTSKRAKNASLVRTLCGVPSPYVGRDGGSLLLAFLIACFMFGMADKGHIPGVVEFFVPRLRDWSSRNSARQWFLEYIRIISDDSSVCEPDLLGIHFVWDFFFMVQKHESKMKTDRNWKLEAEHG